MHKDRLQGPIKRISLPPHFPPTHLLIGTPRPARVAVGTSVPPADRAVDSEADAIRGRG